MRSIDEITSNKAFFFTEKFPSHTVVLASEKPENREMGKNFLVVKFRDFENKLRLL